RRNLPLALILGTATVAGIYLLVNLAYLVGLGFETVHNRPVGPAQILDQALGRAGGQVMDLLVMVSVLGALTGMIFTGSGIFSELGADHRLFAPLGWWHARLGTPVYSLALQAVLSIAMVVAAAPFWRGATEAERLQPSDGFEDLLRCTAPVFWLFF